MNTSTKLAGFAAVVVAVFGGATGIGAAVGPLDGVTERSTTEHDMGEAPGAEHGAARDPRSRD